MNRLLVTFQKELFSYSTVSWIVAVVFYLWRGFELHTTIALFQYPGPTWTCCRPAPTGSAARSGW